MHSPFSFFIFVMSILFFAVLIPGIFLDTFELFKDSFNVLLSLHSFFFSDVFFYAFAQVLQSLFLSFGHASPLLDESQDFSIFIKEFFSGSAECDLFNEQRTTAPLRLEYNLVSSGNGYKTVQIVTRWMAWQHNDPKFHEGKSHININH